MGDREEVFEELADQYRKLRGVDVIFELYAPTTAYTFKVRSAAQVSRLPDIYGVLLQQSDLAAFVKAGHVHDLTPYMEQNGGEWKDVFFENALDMNSFSLGNLYGVKPGIYGVPVDVNNIQFVYNLDLLERAGWDISELPSTWEDFLSLCDLLKANKISGLVSGWGEAWFLNCLADNFAYNIMGPEKIVDTIMGEVSYVDEEWLEVLQLFEDMRDHDVFFPGSVTMVNREAEQIFAMGRSAIAFNGSWSVNIYEGINPDLRYAPALPPKIKHDKPMSIWGGATNFVVNESSSVKKEAVDFLVWLTEEKQQLFLADRTNNIPSNRHCVGALKGPIAKFAENMDKVVHPRLFPVEEFPSVSEALSRGIQSIIIGESISVEVAKRIQEKKAREVQKAERGRALRGEEL